jgi:hypothetical protein
MPLAITATGRYPISGLLSKGPGSAEWLAKVQAFLEEREGNELLACEIVEGPDGPVLLAQLHPAAEPMAIGSAGTGRVEINAASTLVGPGHHEHVIDLIDAMAKDLGVKWSLLEDDDGELSRGRPAIEAAALDALEEAVGEILELDGPGPHLLGLPAAEMFLQDGLVSTLMGPRDRTWAERTVAEPSAGRDVLPWWTSGRGAPMLRDRSVHLMWTDVRWRAPLDDAEREGLERVAADLERAHALDASLAMPWREWGELLALLGREDDLSREIAEKARGAKGPLIGYRRGEVLTALAGGFAVRLPGSFRSEMDEDGTWSSTDGPRALHALVRQAPSRGDMPGDATPLVAKLELEGEQFTHGAGRAGLREDVDEDGTPLFVLSCVTAWESYFVRATITYVDAKDRDWALATWRSLVHPSVRAEPGAGGDSALPGITG